MDCLSSENLKGRKELLVSNGMIAHRTQGKLVPIAHIPQFVDHACHFTFDTFQLRVSNLAQNSDSRGAIVRVVKMRTGRPFLPRFARPSHAALRYMCRKLTSTDRNLIDNDKHRFSTVSRSVPQTVHRHSCNFLETVCVRGTTGSGFRIAKNVSVLWVDHASFQVVLSGVWEVVSASWYEIEKHDEYDKTGMTRR
jgi:hypothetical protein